MKHSIETILRGVEILQRHQLAARTELLELKEQQLADLLNEGRKAMYHVQAVLREELSRMERGYGDYKYGVTGNFFDALRVKNPMDITLATGPRELEALERLIADLKAPIDPDRLVHEKLRKMLVYARDSNGMTEVEDGWLQEAGFNISHVTDALLVTIHEGSNA